MEMMSCKDARLASNLMLLSQSLSKHVKGQHLIVQLLIHKHSDQALDQSHMGVELSLTRGGCLY